MNPTLRERIDKSIVRKLIKANINFGLGAPIKGKKILKITDELAANKCSSIANVNRVADDNKTNSMLMSKRWLMAT